MASQSSLDELSTPVEQPSTPQPQELDLPSVNFIKRTMSPTTSVMVAAGQSSSIHSSSITPPPSSQVPARRSITPDATVLSSPPPTLLNGVKREASSTSKFVPPTQEQIKHATPEKLQELMKSIMAENSKLEIAAREARMSAAHYKLQHNLLTIDSEEAIKRMEVEHDLTRREVQVLQHQGRPSDGYAYTTKLKAYCENLQEEKNLAQARLHKAKKVIRDTEYELETVKDDNTRLRERIRQNREHINTLRSPGGPLYMGTPKTSPTTPQHYRSTPKQTPSSARSIRHQPPESARPFEALLLADAVLSQENNSAPSTPILSHRLDGRTPNRHQRGAQSLSSLPNTPGGSVRRPANINSGLLPSVRFSPEAEAHVSSTIGWGAIQTNRERRRRSRDSTISADDIEAIAAASRSFRDQSEEIQESQASQSATEMLRYDPRESFEVAASRTGTPTTGGKFTTQQGKIFGSITKTGAGKRKLLEEDFGTQHSQKKLKAVAGEAIGLGIGLSASRT